MKIKWKKQVDALKDLKPKAIEGEYNNQSRASVMSNNLITERKNIMSELYDSADSNNLKFEYVDPTKDVSFYEYMHSKELFDKIRNIQIKFSEAKNKQNEFLNKLSTIKIGKKTTRQKEVINNF